jgi:hypothetical protein
MPDAEIAPGPLVGGPVVAAVIGSSVSHVLRRLRFPWLPGRGPGRRTMPLTDHVTC